ncbi:MAG: hypothetical protein ACM3UV_00215, partial [Nocardioidaceae bacterium]
MRRVSAERAGQPGRNLLTGVPTGAGGLRPPTTVELERAVRRLRSTLRAAERRREKRRRAAPARAAAARADPGAAAPSSGPGAPPAPASRARPTSRQG